GALLGIRHVLGDAGEELRPRRLLVLALEDLRARAHHLREGPVGDALAVREAASPVPPRVLREAVEVLEELPREARLADPGDAGDLDELRLRLLGGGVVELLDEPQLALAPDERRLEPLGAQRAELAGGHADGAVEADGLRLPLQLVLARLLEGPRLL